MSLVIFFLIWLHSLLYCYKAYNRNGLDLFSYVIFWFGFIFGIVPFLIVWDRDSYMFHLYHRIIPEVSFLLESLVILTSYIFLFVGRNTYNRKGISVYIPIGKNSNRIFNVAVVMYVIGCIAYAYYVQSYGGIQYVLNNVSQIRSGTDDNKNYLGAFIRMFASFIVYSFILLFYLYFKGYFKIHRVKFLFFVLVIVSVLGLSLLDGGRASLITKVIYVFLAFYFLKGKVKKKYLVIVVFIGLFVVFFGKTFIFSMFSSESEVTFSEVRANQSKEGYGNAFVYEFNHQFLSLSNFIQNDYEYRYLKDYVIWAVKPMKLIDNDDFYDSISYYNTFMISGYWGSDIPPGFVALAFINGGLLIVILQSLFIGRWIRGIDLMFIRSSFKSNGFLFLIYIYLFDLSWFGLQNGDIALIIQSSIVFILLIIVLLFSNVIKVKKNV